MAMLEVCHATFGKKAASPLALQQLSAGNREAADKLIPVLVRRSATAGCILPARRETGKWQRRSWPENYPMVIGGGAQGGPIEPLCGFFYSLSSDLIHWMPLRFVREAMCLGFRSV